MKNHPFARYAVITILLVGISISPALADEGALGQQAEQSGKLRQALTHYVSALQSASEGSSKDRQLREKIIKLAQKIQPLPAVPEETHRYMARGEAFVEAANDKNGFLRAAKEFQAAARAAPCDAAKRELAYGQAATEDAKDQQGFLRAAREFEKAAKKAPNCAAAYFNLGVVYEKAGELSAAKSAYQRYLKLDPKAPDAARVEQQVFKLEYRIKRAGQTKRAADTQKRQKQKQESANILSGFWVDAGGPIKYRIDVNGPSFEIFMVAYCPYGDCGNGWRTTNKKKAIGRLEKGVFKTSILHSSAIEYYPHGGSLKCRSRLGSYEGTVQLDQGGRRFTVTVDIPGFPPSCPSMAVMLNLRRAK